MPEHGPSEHEYSKYNEYEKKIRNYSMNIIMVAA